MNKGLLQSHPSKLERDSSNKRYPFKNVQVSLRRIPLTRLSQPRSDRLCTFSWQTEARAHELRLASGLVPTCTAAVSPLIVLNRFWTGPFSGQLQVSKHWVLSLEMGSPTMRDFFSGVPSKATHNRVPETKDKAPPRYIRLSWVCFFGAGFCNLVRPSQSSIRSLGPFAEGRAVLSLCWSYAHVGNAKAA